MQSLTAQQPDHFRSFPDCQKILKSLIQQKLYQHEYNKVIKKHNDQDSVKFTNDSYHMILSKSLKQERFDEASPRFRQDLYIKPAKPMHSFLRRNNAKKKEEKHFKSSKNNTASTSSRIKFLEGFDSKRTTAKTQDYNSFWQENHKSFSEANSISQDEDNKFSQNNYNYWQGYNKVKILSKKPSVFIQVSQQNEVNIDPKNKTAKPQQFARQRHIFRSGFGSASSSLKKRSKLNTSAAAGYASHTPNINLLIKQDGSNNTMQKKQSQLQHITVSRQQRHRSSKLKTFSSAFNNKLSARSMTNSRLQQINSSWSNTEIIQGHKVNEEAPPLKSNIFSFPVRIINKKEESEDTKIEEHIQFRQQKKSLDQDVSSYIECLRDRKIKLQSVMKSMGLEQESRKSDKLEENAESISRVLTRQVSTKRANLTTSYNGDLIEVNQKAPGGTKSFGNCGSSVVSPVPFKVKDFNNKNATLLNGIINLSSLLGSLQNKLSQQKKQEKSKTARNIGQTQKKVLPSSIANFSSTVSINTQSMLRQPRNNIRKETIKLKDLKSKSNLKTKRLKDQPQNKENQKPKKAKIIQTTNNSKNYESNGQNSNKLLQNSFKLKPKSAHKKKPTFFLLDQSFIE